MFATQWSEKENLEFAAHLLIECKYRSPGKSLLLLPEPNVWVRPSTLGGTVMSLDQFVPYHLALNAFLELEAGCAVVYKGVEIYEKDSAVDAEFRRAIQQLRYGMPAALHRAIELCMFGGHDTMHAMFLALS